MSCGFGEGFECDVCHASGLTAHDVTTGSANDVCRFCAVSFTPEQSYLLNGMEMRLRRLEDPT